MENKHLHASNRSYEDFDPLFTWRREEGRDTLELHLPGFRRDQVRIQINHLGLLVISGERPLDGTKWRRFKKEFEIPHYCNEDAIHGNLMQNILSVVMPIKKGPLFHQEDQDGHIPEIEQEEEKKTNQNMEFGTEDTRDHTTKYQFEENDHVDLTPETTREVALKFMVVIIMILVIASYLAEVSKSLMAQAQSYFYS